jgi:DNA-binding LacI/PurR family transcriptional regulator
VWTLDSVAEVDGLVEELQRGGITAVLAEQQLLAEELLVCATRRGLAIPDDLSVVELGDSTGARHDGTPWTGLIVPREEMGRQAMGLLVQLLEAPDSGARSESVPCGFAPGATVGPPKELP